MTTPPDKNNNNHNITKFVIYRADSDFNSSNRSSHNHAASIMAASTASGASKRDYIEANSGTKDIFFIFLFALILPTFLGICGYGCYLAYTPLMAAGQFSYGATGTDIISLQTILAQIYTTALLSGIISIVAVSALNLFPKAIYQVTILSAPIVYLALTVVIGYYCNAQVAGIIFMILFVLHAIYLISRKKHIRMYRYLMIEAVKLGNSDDKYFTPILVWGGLLLFTGFAITGGFGHFKMFLDKYGDNGALYGFFFSFIVFGWLWIVNLIRNQYKLVVAGLCLNELLREGTLHEEANKLKSKMWKYSFTRFFGQSLYGAFIISLAELFVLMILFMRYESIQNITSYLFVLVACQHVVSFVFKQSGLIHNVMFGSSFFDGTFDVYIPFVFYDELCGHVISLLLLVIIGGSCAIVGKMATLYMVGDRVKETSFLLATISSYIILIVSEIFYDFVRTSVMTHIISFGENPVVLSRTSPIFTEAVRVLRITEDPSIIET